MAESFNDNVVDFTTKSEQKVPLNEADKALYAALGKFPNVIVIGVNDDGQLDFVTNKTSYTFMQWAFSKAAFDLHLHERANSATK